MIVVADNAMKITVIVKALNEEKKIAGCLESVINSTLNYNAEIILVDSLSTDSTVEIAKKYPIKIVQFNRREDCSCGAAAQLGYQYSSGDFIYLIDGDMEMLPGFLAPALSHLENNVDVAGVGGVIVDTSIKTSAERMRATKYSKIISETKTNSLGGGGLYKRSAINSVGYFSHSGLAACEEAELGVRLRSKGWSIVRIPIPSVAHQGHAESTIHSMRRLWRNGRLASHGLFLKSSFGKRWFWLALRVEWFVLAPLIVNLYSAALFLTVQILYPASTTTLAFHMFITWLAVFLILSIKKKSTTEAITSIIFWHLAFAASAASIAKKVKKPHSTISAKILGQS